MLGRIVTGVVVAMASVLAPGIAGAAPPETVSVVVVLEPGADAARLAPGIAAAHGGRVGSVFTEVLGGFHFEGPASALGGLQRAAGVRAVVPDATFELTDDAGWGFFRIDAEISIFDPNGPYRGAGVRVAVIDSGVDLDHPDLATNIDHAAGYNCVTPGAPPDDDNGHGTHVAGVAAANFDGSGAAGIAPEAAIVPLKAFDATGNGSTAQILCAFDRLAQVVAASPAPTVVNMSFADVGTDSSCDDADASDVLHEALCDLVDAGSAVGSPVVPVAAAGNSATDASNTIPAAFHDVITVSALTDLDGNPGGAGGCTFPATTFAYECDDMLASFSNRGASIDLAAPGVEVWSTVPGGWGVKSGTSMAAPHVAGVVALVLGEHAALDTVGVKALLTETGECPDGSVAGPDGSCVGQGQWHQTSGWYAPEDPDGIPEPLVNAARAAAAADERGDPPPTDLPPSVSVLTPADGVTVSGTVAVTASADDDSGVTSVAFAVDGTELGVDTDGSDGWSALWDTTSSTDGAHDVQATATDTAGQTATSTVTVTVANAPAPGPTMHVADLIGSTSGGKKWTATVTAVVHDAGGAPVEGVTVIFDLSGSSTSGLSATTEGKGPGGGGGGGGGGGKPGPGPGPSTLTCVTDATGRCSVSTKPSGSTVTFTLRSLDKAGWVHDTSADVTTSITLSR